MNLHQLITNSTPILHQLAVNASLVAVAVMSTAWHNRRQLAKRAEELLDTPPPKIRTRAERILARAQKAGWPIRAAKVLLEAADELPDGPVNLQVAAEAVAGKAEADWIASCAPRTAMKPITLLKAQATQATPSTSKE